MGVGCCCELEEADGMTSVVSLELVIVHDVKGTYTEGKHIGKFVKRPTKVVQL